MYNTYRENPDINDQDYQLEITSLKEKLKISQEKLRELTMNADVEIETLYSQIDTDKKLINSLREKINSLERSIDEMVCFKCFI